MDETYDGVCPECGCQWTMTTKDFLNGIMNGSFTCPNCQTLIRLNETEKEEA